MQTNVRKRALLFLLLMLVTAVCVVLAFPLIQFQFLGAIQGEAFYKGKPASYWAAALSGDPSTQEQEVGKTFREGGAQAVPVLAQLLRDENLHVQSLALMFFEQNQEDISGCVPALEDYLLAPDSLEFSKAIALLKRVDEPAARDVLIRCMHSQADPQKRVAAITAVPLFGPEDPVVLANLESCLDDPELPVRIASAQKMVEFKYPHARLPKVFIESLQLEGSAAVLPWWYVTKEFHDETVPKLFELLHSPVSAIQHNAALAFYPAQMKPADVPWLVRELNNERSDIRVSAVNHLGYLARADGSALNALIGLVRSDSDDRVRRDAVSCLGQLGPAAARAIPDLTALVRQKNSPDRLGVVTSLLSIDSENQEAVAAVSELLANSKPKFPGSRLSERETVAMVLGDMGQAAHATIPVLLNALGDASRQFRCHAALALAKIGNSDEKLVAVLIDLLRSDDLEVVLHACYVLQIIGPPAKMAIPELKKVIAGPRPTLHRNAITAGVVGIPFTEADVATWCAAALWRVEPENELSRKTLIARLRDPQPERRSAAATAIANLGANAKELTPIVSEALNKETLPSIQGLLREALDATSQGAPK